MKTKPLFIVMSAPSGCGKSTLIDLILQEYCDIVDEIRANDYDLSINKYKEVEREIVHYDAPEVIFAEIEALEADVQQRMAHLKEMLS